MFSNLSYNRNRSKINPNLNLSIEQQCYHLKFIKGEKHFFIVFKFYGSKASDEEAVRNLFSCLSKGYFLYKLKSSFYQKEFEYWIACNELLTYFLKCVQEENGKFSREILGFSGENE